MIGLRVVVVDVVVVVIIVVVVDVVVVVIILVVVDVVVMIVASVLVGRLFVSVFCCWACWICAQGSRLEASSSSLLLML